LQTEIALSATESENIALPMATRELLPLRQLALEIHNNVFIATTLENDCSITKTISLAAIQLFEDNASFIVLAYNEGLKAKTKHISLKWHHFRDQLKTGYIQIVKADVYI
jgi:hypothetical protein